MQCAKKIFVGVIGVVLVGGCYIPSKQPPVDAAVEQIRDETKSGKFSVGEKEKGSSAMMERPSHAAGGGLFGMEAGDILQRIDGETAIIASPDQALEWYTRLRGRQGCL